MNSDLYYEILVNKLKPGIRNKRRGKLSKGVLFLHGNARPHTSCKTVSTIIKLGFEVLEHPAYSPDLAPSDYFLFGLLKKELKGKRFDSDEDVQKVVQYFFTRFLRVPIKRVFTSCQNGGVDSEEIISRSSPFWNISGFKVKVEEDYVEQYLGIPYAEPPIGDLRFQKPQRLKKFPSELPAFNYSNICYQHHSIVEDYIKDSNGVYEEAEESEDCLYLNIWTPKSSRKQKKAVMFWIHGGGFIYGSGNSPLYNGSMLSALGDVVVVTSNYRLGIMGFFTSGNNLVPGNMGLYDQLMALQWVKQNIEFFGGDPERITIFGPSAGGASVSIFVTSDKPKGLFKRAIIQSGVPNSPALIYSVKKVKQISAQLSLFAGCPTNFNSEITQCVIKCLKSKSPSELIVAQYVYSKSVNTNSFIGAVYEERFVSYISHIPFMPQYFVDFELIISVTSDDIAGLFMAFSPTLFLHPFSLDETYSTLRELFKRILNINDLQPVLDYYFKDVIKDNYTDINIKMSNLATDIIEICPTIFFAKLLSVIGYKVFLSYFNYPTTTPYFQLLPLKWAGAFHFDDVIYIFGTPLMRRDLNYTKLEHQFARDMIRMWSNFAKNGAPHPEWTPVVSGSKHVAAFQTNPLEYKMLPQMPSESICYSDIGQMEPEATFSLDSTESENEIPFLWSSHLTCGG
ncbi:BCHE [Cordylochernes scorpioides]|uniref:Carboxylic ester hydrolase n=1 Tax=Cordylochernes scorpioides TaxID=51811 RepID=A0ABY6KBW0_9ARAC|nr:BCHE [Cordylochernes scorpioides]